MTDDLSQAEFLESLARRIARLEDQNATYERERMESMLGTPGSSRIGLPDLPVMAVGASDTDRTLGNTAPYYGQTNLLLDSSLELVEAISPIGTAATGTGVWRSDYDLNSGTAPTTRSLELIHGRADDKNPYNSCVAQLRLTGFASGNTTFYYYPNVGFVADADTPDLPYLVAAVRVGDFGSSGNTVTNITSITVSLQIIDAAGNVEAESLALDFKDLITRRPEQQQLFCAFQPDNDTFKWRLKVVVVASGSGGTVRIKFGEPQLHYSYSPDPAPFAPIIARHFPVAVYYPSSPTTGDAPVFLRAKYTGQASLDLFQIRADGRMAWGDGLGGGLDAFLERGVSDLTGSPPGLQIGDDVSGGIITRYDGPDNFNAFTPTLTGGGVATFTSTLGWWQRIGKMVLISAHVTVNAAGSGATAVQMALPFAPDRSQIQTFASGGVGLFVAGIANGGVAIVTTAGVGSTINQFRLSGDAATNRDQVLTGADLLAGSQVFVQGVYRAA